MQTDRHTGRHNIQIGRFACRQIVMDRQTERVMDRQTDRGTDRQTANRQTNRWTVSPSGQSVRQDSQSVRTVSPSVRQTNRQND